DSPNALRLPLQCLLAGFHQNLSDSVRDKTTWLYTDYAEGLRPAPRRAAASRPAVQRRPAEIDSAPHPGTVTAAQAPPSDAGASVGAPTVVLVSTRAWRFPVP